MLNVAVIGVGSMGKNHARVYSNMDEVNLVAVADVDETSANQIAKRHRCKAYTDYNEMLLKEKPDFVSVVVPTSLHKKVAFDVIEQGINLLIEKPIAATVEEGRAIIDFAKQKNVRLMIGHIERFNPVVIELKKRLDNNELGRIYKIDVLRIGPFPNRIRDVGVVIDLAAHDLDIIRYITGSEVKKAYAEIDNKINSTHEDMVKALIRLENNAVCSLNVDWLTPTKLRKLFVTGEKGMFELNYLNQNLNFYENAVLNGKQIAYSDMMQGVLEGKMTKFCIKKKEPLVVELEHFVDCVKNNKEPLHSGEEALKALELSHMLIKSGK